MKAAINLKRSVADISIFCIIIGEFRYWEKSSPVVLFIDNKNPEIGFHSTILTFCLTVRLGVKCIKEISLNTQKVIKW